MRKSCRSMALRRRSVSVTIRLSIGELFLELGLIWSLAPLSKFSLNISFCTSIIFSNTANISASAWAVVLSRMYLASMLCQGGVTLVRRRSRRGRPPGSRRIRLRRGVR